MVWALGCVIFLPVDRVARMYQLWGWLPHFRAIAETEHLPSASAALGVSASALSRALKQLEAAVGRELFVRDGRTMQLNAHGRELLDAVREGMRGIDDAITRINGDQLPTLIRVSAAGPLHSSIVLDIASEIAAEHPTVRLALLSCESDELVARLLRGDLDLALHDQPIVDPQLLGRRLGAVENVVACAPMHPLAAMNVVSLDELGDHPFVAPPDPPTGAPVDGWPADVPRNVAVRADRMQLGVDACRTGRYLALLPRPVVDASGLRALSVSSLVLPQVPLYATTRTLLPRQSPAFAAFVDALCAAFETDD